MSLIICPAKCRSVFKGVFLVVALLALPIISGCSAGGYLIGSALDHVNERGFEKQKYHAHCFERGEDIRIVTTDSAVIVGKFTRIVESDDNTYANRCRRARKRMDKSSPLPELKDTITVQTASGNVTTGEFLGYDMHFLEQNVKIDSENKWPESAYQSLNLNPLPGSSPSRILLKDIDSVSYSDGNLVDVGMFRMASASGTLPLRSAILVKTENGDQTIPFDEANRIYKFRKTKVRWVFFAIGLAVDAAAIAFAIAMSSMGPIMGTANTTAY